MRIFSVSCSISPEIICNWSFACVAPSIIFFISRLFESLLLFLIASSIILLYSSCHSVKGFFFSLFIMSSVKGNFHSCFINNSMICLVSAFNACMLSFLSIATRINTFFCSSVRPLTFIVFIKSLNSLIASL